MSENIELELLPIGRLQLQLVPHARRVAQHLQPERRQPSRTAVATGRLSVVVPGLGLQRQPRLPSEAEAGVVVAVAVGLPVIAPVEAEGDPMLVVGCKVAVGSVEGLEQGLAGGGQLPQSGVSNLFQPVEAIE